jgi:hypothetical protein
VLGSHPLDRERGILEGFERNLKVAQYLAYGIEGLFIFRQKARTRGHAIC